MRAVVMLFAFALPIGLVTTLGTSDGASNAPTPAPAAPGQVTFIPIDRTHVLLALPARAAPNAAQPKNGGGAFVAPSAGVGANGAMPFYPPPGTSR